MSDTPPSPDLLRADEKTRLRRRCLEARDHIDGAERQSAAIAVLRHMPTWPSGAVVAGYWPIRSEFDPRPLMAHLDSHGHPLALPVVAADRQTLLFRR